MRIIPRAKTRTQNKLPFGELSSTTKRSRALLSFEAANRRAAEIILEHPERNGGAGAYPVEWAQHGILASAKPEGQA